MTLSPNERNYHVLYLLVERASHRLSQTGAAEHPWAEQSFLNGIDATSFRMLSPQGDAAAPAAAEKEATSQANKYDALLIVCLAGRSCKLLWLID